jgi:ribonuclease Z
VRSLPIRRLVERYRKSHRGTQRHECRSLSAASPLRVIGPKGTQKLISHLEQAYADDIKIRIEDEKLPRDGIAIAAAEFDGDGVVYEHRGVKVSAFEVDHGDVIKPAYGYRIEYGGRVVVISGDTRPNQNVIKHGTGADLLIHEVAIVRSELATEPFIQRIMAHHTSAFEAGKIFECAKPKPAAFTHLVFLSSQSVPPASLDDLLAETRRTYSGPLVIGEDLMSFKIGDYRRRWTAFQICRSIRLNQ